MAEKDLTTLLKTLSINAYEGQWQFQTIPAVEEQPGLDPDCVFMFKEQEGVTRLVPATEDTPEENRWAWLELSVYSDLNAVGFLAAVSNTLAKAGLPCNAVAAYHHDHIFVPVARKQDAIDVLMALKARN